MHVDEISSLDKELDNTAHEALEDLLTQVGLIFPESTEACTTADAQGIVWLANMYNINFVHGVL